MEKPNEITELIQHIIEANHIPVNYLEYPYENCDNLDMGLRSEIFEFKDVAEYNIRAYRELENRKLYFLSDVFHCNYAVLLLPDEKTFFVCGPVLCEKIKGERFERVFADFKLPEAFREPLRNYYGQIICVPAQSWFENILIEYSKVLYGVAVEVVHKDMTDFENYNVVYKNFFRIPEQPFSNIEVIEKRYEMENGIIEAISSGNEIAAYEILVKMSENTNLSPQRLADELRDKKDYSITLNSLARKSVEGAGVHPIYIDSISNSFIAEIEGCMSVEQCENIMRKIIGTYCHLVKECNHQDNSPLIKKVLAYIDTDLCTDLTLKTFSRHLNVNASYLSSLFSKEMGVSLTDYVNLCRIHHAQRLLLGTNLPIKSIAEQCGFSDIHYFSRLFKKIVEITPKAYRESYYLIDKRELYRLEKKEK